MRHVRACAHTHLAACPGRSEQCPGAACGARSARWPTQNAAGPTPGTPAATAMAPCSGGGGGEGWRVCVWGAGQRVTLLHHHPLPGCWCAGRGLPTSTVHVRARMQHHARRHRQSVAVPISCTRGAVPPPPCTCHFHTIQPHLQSPAVRPWWPIPPPLRPAAAAAPAATPPCPPCLRVLRRLLEPVLEQQQQRDLVVQLANLGAVATAGGERQGQEPWGPVRLSPGATACSHTPARVVQVVNTLPRSQPWRPGANRGPHLPGNCGSNVASPSWSSDTAWSMSPLSTCKPRGAGGGVECVGMCAYGAGE